MKRIFIGLFLLSFSGISLQAETVSTSMDIKLRLAYPSCKINDGNGFTQNITLDPVSKGQLISNDSLTPSNVPIVVDCSAGTDVPDNFYISMAQVYPVGDATLLASGKLKTTKEGVGIQLTWARSGNPVSIVTGTEIGLKGSVNVNQAGLVFDASMKAVPILLSGVNAYDIQPGNYTAKLNVTLSYK